MSEELLRKELQREFSVSEQMLEECLKLSEQRETDEKS